MSDEAIILAALIAAAAGLVPLFGFFFWTIWDSRNLPKFPPHPSSPFWEKERQRAIRVAMDEGRKAADECFPGAKP